MPRLLLVVAALTVPAFLVGDAYDLYWLRVLVKPWPVLALAVGVHRLGRRLDAGPIALGLVFSAVGDVLLEVSPATFLPGVGAFLLAHLAYVAAFLRHTKLLHWPWAVPFAAWGASVVIVLRPGLVTAGMLVPVAIYTAVICSMMWRAAARLAVGAAAASRLAFAGALLFAASDTLIAVQRFGDDLAFAGIRVVIILLYWLGQAMIAGSTLDRAAPRSA